MHRLGHVRGIEGDDPEGGEDLKIEELLGFAESRKEGSLDVGDRGS